MRVVNKKEFFELPEGTFYCKGGEWFFDQLNIKYETTYGFKGEPIDWWYLDMNWSNGEDSNECFNILENSLKTGASFEAQAAISRDGLFEDKDLFIVYEKDDLHKLRDHIDLALQYFKYKDRDKGLD